MEADNSNEPEDDSSEIHLYVCLFITGGFNKLVAMEGWVTMLLGCLRASFVEQSCLCKHCGANQDNCHTVTMNLRPVCLAKIR